MRKGFYFGLQVSLFKDRQGLKFALKFRLFKFYREKVWFLKRYPKFGVGNPDLTPKMECPEMLTEVPVVKQIEPEDMDTEIELDKPLEPEDM